MGGDIFLDKSLLPANILAFIGKLKNIPASSFLILDSDLLIISGSENTKPITWTPPVQCTYTNLVLLSVSESENTNQITCTPPVQCTWINSVLFSVLESENTKQITCTPSCSVHKQI